jgi:hypothetical protein
MTSTHRLASLPPKSKALLTNHDDTRRVPEILDAQTRTQDTPRRAASHAKILTNSLDIPTPARPSFTDAKQLAKPSPRAGLRKMRTLLHPPGSPGLHESHTQLRDRLSPSLESSSASAAYAAIPQRKGAAGTKRRVLTGLSACFSSCCNNNYTFGRDIFCAAIANYPVVNMIVWAQS